MAKHKKIVGYVYQADMDAGELIVPNSNNAFSSNVFASIRARLANVKSLPNSLNIQVFPLNFKEGVSDLLMRSYFKRDNYRILAAKIDADDEIVDFLLVEKSTWKSGFVVSYRRLEIDVSFHDGCYVREDEELINPIDVFGESLDGDLSLGGKGEKPVDMGFAPIKEEEEKPEVNVEVTPAPFEPSSNKKMKNLGTSKVILEKEALEKEEEEEGEDSFLPPPEKASFAPVSKKSIPNLGSYSSKKREKPVKQTPAPVSKPKEEGESIPELPKYFEPSSKKTPGKILTEKERKIEKPVEAKPKKSGDIPPFSSPTITHTPFSATSKGKPKAIKDSYQWLSSSEARFEFDKGYPQSKLQIHLPRNKGFDEASILDALSKVKGFKIRFNCLCVPEVFDDDSAFVRSIENFDSPQWFPLAVFADAYRRPYRYLLCRKDDPYLSFACTLGKNPCVYCLSSKGFSLAFYRGDYEDLLKETLFAFNKPEKEEPIIEEEPILEETEESVEEAVEAPAPEIKPVSPKEKAKERRKIYYTGHFKRQMASFLLDSPKDGKEELEELIFDLQTKEEEELEGYLNAKNAKLIHENEAHRMRKFRFSGMRQFSAMRVFYLKGDSLGEIDRKIAPNDFLLMALSTDHEGQGKVAKTALEHFGKNSPIYYFAPPRFAQREEPLVQLSSEQWKYLEEGETFLPAAFVGTAGSGKTLMSYQAYLDLSEDEGKVLYLTYQRGLASQANDTLSMMNVKNAEALTYRDLVKKIFGEEQAKRMRTKDRFRAWFYKKSEKDQKNYHRDFSRLAHTLSQNLEDAFHIAYVFYRGVIEGSLDCLKGGGILSKEAFFAKMGGEMGLEKEQKEAIYEIALEYERHLYSKEGKTDNKFALDLLKAKPKEIYDAIIVDEYQDLTELQILSLTSLLKSTLPHRILLFGDDNQAVNPTILNISGVNSVIQHAFRKDKKKCELHIHTLSSSYRSGPNLLSYINEVLSLKDKAIGKDKKENILARNTFREDEDDLYVTTLRDKELFPSLLLSAKNSDRDAVFIFPSAAFRDEAKERYAPLLEGYEKDNFLSVEEAKGREWDSCVLVDFLSSSKGIFEGMLGEDRIGHRSTVHRMMFNRYYVALTRAENRVIVYESDAGELSSSFFLSPLTPLEGEGDIKRIFDGELNPIHWIEVGDQLFQKGDYVGSSRAYRRASSLEEGVARLKKSEFHRDAFLGMIEEEEAIEGLLSYGDYKVLLSYYEERNLYEKRKLFRTLLDKKKENAEKLEAYKAYRDVLTDSERQHVEDLLVEGFQRSLTKMVENYENRKRRK